MTVDIIASIFIIMAALLGLRDGFWRKLIGIGGTVAGIIAAQYFRQDAAALLADVAGFDPADAPTWGFLFVWIVVQMLVALIFRVSYSRGSDMGFPERFFGAALGFGQGVLVVSMLLLLVKVHGYPTRREGEESRFYKPLVGIAPQVFDMAESVTEKIREATQDELETTPASTTAGKPQPGKKGKKSDSTFVRISPRSIQ